MFRIAYLEKPRVGPLRIEERLMSEYLAGSGTQVELYTLKQIERRSLPLGPDTFIMGTIPSMHGAMKQLQIPIPFPSDYPEPLLPFLRRRVWRSTLKALEQQVRLGLDEPIFAKPAERCKAFTGRVFAFSEDLYYVGMASRRQEIWCSDVVRWLVEYRLFVIDDHAVAIDHYAGDPGISLSMDTVSEALRIYRQSGLAPSAYGIDFGVLASGETALVEANDGFSLGAYQVVAKPYSDVLLTRWQELLASRQSQPQDAEPRDEPDGRSGTARASSRGSCPTRCPTTFQVIHALTNRVEDRECSLIPRK